MYVLVGTSVNIMSIFRSCACKWHYLYACYFVHGHLVSQLKIYCLFCVQIYETSAAAVHKCGCQFIGATCFMSFVWHL